MMTESSSSSRYTLSQSLRHSHSVSLLGHNLVDPITGCPKFPVRSALLLPARQNGPALPTLPFDNSKEVVDENLARRSLHSRVLGHDPNAFKRRSGPETTSTILHEGRILNDFLAGMHGLQDQRDLNPLKVNRLTYSRRQERDKMEKAEVEELQFNNLSPIEDFLRPSSVITPRQTGYESGHIRSLLKTDTFGPASSSVVSDGRSRGLLPPHSPQVDRHADDARAMTITRQKSVHSRSSASRSPSKTSQYRGSSSLDTVSAMKDLFHQGSAVNFDLDMDGFRKVQTGTGTVGYFGPAYTEQDRLLVDPLLKRNTWYKGYVQTIKDRQRAATTQQLFRHHREKQTELAQSEVRAIAAFENHLVLAKHEV